jgi:hypothetical protein
MYRRNVQSRCDLHRLHRRSSLQLHALGVACGALGDEGVLCGVHHLRRVVVQQDHVPLCQVYPRQLRGLHRGHFVDGPPGPQVRALARACGDALVLQAGQFCQVAHRAAHDAAPCRASRGSRAWQVAGRAFQVVFARQVAFVGRAPQIEVVWSGLGGVRGHMSCNFVCL